MPDKLELNDAEKVVGADGQSKQQLICPNCSSIDYTEIKVRISPTVVRVLCTCNVCGTTWKNNFDSSDSSGKI